MPAMDLCFTPASRLAALIRQRKVSPLQVTQAVLAQIERVNPKVNAYCTVAAKTALADARKATSAVTRRSARLGPLHGVPVSIKDLTPTRGIRTTWGSKIYEHDVPTEDVGRFEEEFLDQLHRTRPGVLDAIRETGQLSDDTVASLKDAIEEFKKGFETSSGELLVQDEPVEAMDPSDVEQEKIKQYQRQPEPQVKQEQG